MKDFKILNTAISFDDGLQEYAEIYVHFVKLCDSFSERYTQGIMPIPVSTMEDLITKLDKISIFMNDEIDIVINEVMNYFIKYKLFNKNKEDVKMHSVYMIEYREYIDNIQNEIHKAINDMKYDMDNLMLESKQKAIDTVGTGTYLNVWSSSAFGLLLAESMNASEYNKINRKQSEVWEANYEVGYNQLKSELSEKAKILNKEIKTIIYNYGVNIINEMFECLIHILTLEEKMINPAIDKLNKDSANNIVNNLKRISDEEVKKEQLSIALNHYPFLKTIHKEILNYEFNIDEYIRLVKFIKYEDIIYNYCINVIKTKISNKFEDTDIKYIKILKLLKKKECLKDIVSNNYFRIQDVENMRSTLKNIKKMFNIIKSQFTDELENIDNEEKHLLSSIVQKTEIFYGTKYQAKLDYEEIIEFIQESYEIEQQEIKKQQEINKQQEIKREEKEEEKEIKQKENLKVYGILAILIIVTVIVANLMS